MSSRLLVTISILLVVGWLSGCATTDRRTPTSDALTPEETNLVNQAEAEPEPPKPVER
jgi:hypothetical protein